MATRNPLPEIPCFDDGQFKFVQLRFRFVDNKKDHRSGSVIILRVLGAASAQEERTQLGLSENRSAYVQDTVRSCKVQEDQN